MAVLILTLAIICAVIAAMDFAAFRKAEVTIEAVGNVQARERAVCVIRIRNISRLPVIYKRLGFVVENTYTREKKKSAVRVNVMPGSESEIKMDLSVQRCGKIRCTVKWGFRGKKTVFCNFTILPELFSTHIEYSLHESDIYDSETYSQFRKGQDYSEVFQIREYVPGDNVKHIHWKLSGRTDDLMVKDASFPLDKSLMVVMDKSMPEGECTPDFAEALASITVSVARELSDEGLEYQLVWNRPEENYCEARDIQFDTELADAIPALLTGPVVRSERTCSDIYSQTIGPVRSTHVIYISCGVRAAESETFRNIHVTDIDARTADYRTAFREIDLY